MRRRKSFDYGKDTYYFTIKMFPNNITIHRKEKQAAVNAFQHYKNVGKTVEWLGRWNGKSFEDSGQP